MEAPRDPPESSWDEKEIPEEFNEELASDSPDRLDDDEVEAAGERESGAKPYSEK